MKSWRLSAKVRWNHRAALASSDFSFFDNAAEPIKRHPQESQSLEHGVLLLAQQHLWIYDEPQPIDKVIIFIPMSLSDEG